MGWDCFAKSLFQIYDKSRGMFMSIDELKIFVTVAQTLNFTQAAEQLHFSQPTLSRHISDLEKELGRELFTRTTRKVKLTEFGRHFLVETRRLLKSYQQLLDQMSNLGKQRFGTLTIGTPDLMTRTFLPNVIKLFHQKYPGIMIDIRIIEPGACISMLKNKIIDIGFFASTDSDVTQAAIEVETVSEGRLCLVVGTSHRFSAYDSVPPHELQGEHIYTSARNNTPYLWYTINQFLVQHNLSTAALEEIDSPSALTLLVEAGLGVTIMASNLVPELGNTEHLRLVKLDYLDSHSKLNVAWAKNSSNLCLPDFVETLRQVRPERPHLI